MKKRGSISTGFDPSLGYIKDRGDGVLVDTRLQPVKVGITGDTGADAELNLETGEGVDKSNDVTVDDEGNVVPANGEGDGSTEGGGEGRPVAKIVSCGGMMSVCRKDAWKDKETAKATAKSIIGTRGPKAIHEHGKRHLHIGFRKIERIIGPNPYTARVRNKVLGGVKKAGTRSGGETVEYYSPGTRDTQKEKRLR